jgi:hypothetical protein
MKSKLFTEEQLKFIKNNAKGLYNLELTKLVNDKFKTNYKVSQIESIKNRFKISSGLTGRFEKGHIPANKGTKGVYNIGGNKTSFQKGHISANNLPIGSESWRKDTGGGEKFCFVKVQDGHGNKNWKPKHVVIYENYYGSIPKGYKVIFADRDRTNFDIDNLILVSHQELLIMNKKGLIRKNSSSTKTGHLLSKLINKRNKLKEKRKN